MGAKKRVAPTVNEAPRLTLLTSAEDGLRARLAAAIDAGADDEARVLLARMERRDRGECL
jgi:hypothetical protein